MAHVEGNCHLVRRIYEERTDGDERDSACRYPACISYRKTNLTMWKPGTCRKREYRCDDCADKWKCARIVAGKLQCVTCDANSPRLFDQSSSSKWYTGCRACQHPPCCKCGQRSEEIWTPNPKVKNHLYTCKVCAEMLLCHGPCGRKLSPGAFVRNASRSSRRISRECQFPACVTCGEKSQDIWTPNAAKANAKYTCQKCAPLRTCKGSCKQQLPFNAFDKNSSSHYYQCCRACQYPKCATCGRKRKTMRNLYSNKRVRYAVPLCEACETKKKKVKT